MGLGAIQNIKYKLLCFFLRHVYQTIEISGLTVLAKYARHVRETSGAVWQRALTLSTGDQNVRQGIEGLQDIFRKAGISCVFSPPVHVAWWAHIKAVNGYPGIRVPAGNSTTRVEL